MAQVTQQDGTLHFSGNLLIGNISETLAHMRAFKVSVPLTLDFSHVQSVDTAAISLILEIQREIHQQHPDASIVKIVGVPDNLNSLMKLYGVDSFLLN